MLELKFNFKKPFDATGLSEGRMGLVFLLVNKSKEDVVLSYSRDTTVSLYTVDEKGNKVRFWLPEGAIKQGSLSKRIAKAGETMSFRNPLNIRMIKDIIGKSIVASVTVYCQNQDKEIKEVEVFSETFKIPKLPAELPLKP